MSDCLSSFAAPQAPLSMKFSRQEYWSGLPFQFPGDLLDPRMALRSPALQGDALPSELLGKPAKGEDVNGLSKENG